MSFKKWTDIESLSHVIRSRNQSEWMRNRGVINYRPKIKLHGTNAAIRITCDGVFAQSRTRTLSIEDDNFGFAAWVESYKSQWLELSSMMSLVRMPPITMYGEWAGPGIQKGVASSLIPEKTFFMFASEMDGDVSDKEYEHGTMTLEWGPAVKRIADRIPTFKLLPWAGDVIPVNFEDAGSLANLAAKVNEMVSECEKVDPYIKSEYSIEGPGEGFVFYAVDCPIEESTLYKRFMFKAKGKEHRVNKTKSAATIDPEILKSVSAFVDFAVTEARLNQGLREAVNDVVDPRLTADFLRWIANDVIKECVPELVDNGLDWKQVASPVSKKARDWYLGKGKLVV